MGEDEDKTKKMNKGARSVIYSFWSRFIFTLG